MEAELLAENIAAPNLFCHETAKQGIEWAVCGNEIYHKKYRKCCIAQTGWHL